jgi:endonuclease YncB( thermonuclease family)
MTDHLNSALACLVLAGSLAALAIPEPQAQVTISGYAQAIDGDTLIVAGVRVRLAEIDAPERDQLCIERIPWFCGEEAEKALARILARGPATCSVRSIDVYGRSVASCATSEGDIAGMLVSHGLAAVWPRYSTGAYEDRQEAAKAERLGVWSGEFDWPWEWRKRQGK